MMVSITVTTFSWINKHEPKCNGALFVFRLFCFLDMVSNCIAQVNN